ncbi:hypothetical protein [Parabacteroides johnsonii]|uniref:hypothetical protein n=1 Tax=Parabacteroides johnsonii TaxID=387661 RepID=UPI00242D74F9|nr:hypothetical protein [Parabacteroides johnsonii]
MKTYYLLINILLLSAVCASCSKDEGGNTPEPELPATPKLSIELNSRDIATKAPDDYTPTKELEGIYDYYIYVVDATTNQVEVAVSGTAQSVDKVSVDDIEVEEGKKYVFAFANLKRIESDPIITDILKLTEGASAYGILSNDQTTQAVSFFAGKETNPLLVDGTHHIPMSALMDSTEVSAKERGYVKLDLYRMFAKIEFEFTNKYEGEVVIEEIKMDGFQNGNVYLMPHKFFPAMEAEMKKDGPGNYEAQNSRTYVPFLPNGSYGEIVQPIVLNGETITLDAAPKKTEGSTPTYPKSSGHIYYVNETDLATTREQTPSTRFQISLLMTMDDEKVTKPISLPDHSYIRRNDHMIIPITISDYTFELAVGNSRAPIGGYPKYMQAGVADDFTCTLEYAGKTELFFNLRDVTEKLVEGLTEEDYTLTLVDDPNDLIAPKGSEGQLGRTLKADGTGTITTTINPGSYGTAILSLKITLPDRTLSYTIYLVRERENTGN